MCLPYPHEQCISFAGYSFLGSLVFLSITLIIYSNADRKAANTEVETRDAVFTTLYLTLGGIVAVTVLAEMLFSIIPEGIITQLPVINLIELAEGYGYYSTLIVGPFAFLYLAFGIGGIATAVSHLLIEEYV